MWEPIWTVLSEIILRVVVKVGADAGEQSLAALARWIVKAQVRTLPASHRANIGESILADFELQATTADKLRFVIQMVSAQLKLRVIRGSNSNKPRPVEGTAHIPSANAVWFYGNPRLLPICKLMGRHWWYHHYSPGLYYCRICATQAPRWMGVYKGHGGYHCDLNVKP